MPLFDSVDQALKFAMNHRHGAIPRSGMAKLAAPSVGAGELVGLDGAAQAGMIRVQIGMLGVPYTSTIEARFARPYVHCSCGSPCCTHKRPNPEWITAVDYLVTCALSAHIPGLTSERRLIELLAMRYFGGSRLTFARIAAQCRVNRDTASSHNQKLLGWLELKEGEAMHRIRERLKGVDLVA